MLDNSRSWVSLEGDNDDDARMDDDNDDDDNDNVDGRNQTTTLDVRKKRIKRDETTCILLFGDSFKLVIIMLGRLISCSVVLTRKSCCALRVFCNISFD
jgi:hypothetical protein